MDWNKNSESKSFVCTLSSEVSGVIERSNEELIDRIAELAKENDKLIDRIMELEKELGR